MDWVDLFCGFEGTLGVITKGRLRLLPTSAADLERFRRFRHTLPERVLAGQS